MKVEKFELDISNIMHSLDDLQRVDAPPFLLTKIKARMMAQKNEKPFFLSFLILRPSFASLALIIAIVLNVYLAGQVSHQRKAHVQAENGVESFASVYNLNSYSVYDK